MKWVGILALGALLPALLSAQQFKFNLDQLAAKSAEHVDLNLDGNTLQFAAKFLDSGDAEEAQIKKMVGTLEGIYVRHFTFKTANTWTPADLDAIRAQLRAPEWSRIVGAGNTGGDAESNEIYLRTIDKKLAGVAVIAAEPKELTVVNIAGPIDLDALAGLAGHMGIPKMKLPAGSKGKKE